MSKSSMTVRTAVLWLPLHKELEHSKAYKL